MARSEPSFESFQSEESSNDFIAPSLEIPLCSTIRGGGEVHVWRASLDLDTASVGVLAQILSADELQRAMRFRRPTDCHRFVAARAILRFILGFYLDVEPARIVLTSGRFGKPALCLSDERGPLHFNLSHSQGLALYAASRHFELGIDIEHIRPQLESLHLAEQFLPFEDVSRLRRLLMLQRADAFFQAWTRMEARQKASGKGLAVTPTPATAPCSHQPSQREIAEVSERATISTENLAVRDGYAAALAVVGDGYTVQCLKWPDSFPRWPINPSSNALR